MDKKFFLVKIADIIFRKIYNDSKLTRDEIQLLGKWISSSNENQELWNELNRGKCNVDFEKIVALTDQNKQWKRIECFLSKRKRILMTKISLWAALVILLISIGFSYLYKDSNSGNYLQQGIIYSTKQHAILVLNDGKNIPLNIEDTLVALENSEVKISSGQIQYLTEDTIQTTSELNFNTIIVPRGGVYSLILSDGSKVFLNSDSELTYPVHFDETKREVILKGEAFFEIAYDSDNPFIVKTDMIDIKVLGTVFNVMAYEDEPQIQTTLLSGKVEVMMHGGNKQNILSPGYQSVCERLSEHLYIKKVDVSLKSLWKDGIIILEDANLESVMRMLSRWYDVKYIYKDSLSESHTFTGKIDRNVDLDNVLKKLSLLGGPSFLVEDRIIYISEKNNR